MELDLAVLLSTINSEDHIEDLGLHGSTHHQNKLAKRWHTVSSNMRLPYWVASDMSPSPLQIWSGSPYRRSMCGSCVWFDLNSRRPLSETTLVLNIYIHIHPKAVCKKVRNLVLPSQQIFLNRSGGHLRQNRCMDSRHKIDRRSPVPFPSHFCGPLRIFANPWSQMPALLHTPAHRWNECTTMSAHQSVGGWGGGAIGPSSRPDNIT